MRLNVLVFASWADAFGGPAVDVSVPDGATVDDLLDAIRQLNPGRGLPPAAVAVNEAYVERSYRLSAGDEVAIIPPVAGG